MSQATRTGKRTRHSHTHKSTPIERKGARVHMKMVKEKNPFSMRRYKYKALMKGD